jgi:hypothetical protein
MDFLQEFLNIEKPKPLEEKKSTEQQSIMMAEQSSNLQENSQGNEQ